MCVCVRFKFIKDESLMWHTNILHKDGRRTRALNRKALHIDSSYELEEPVRGGSREKHRNKLVVPSEDKIIKE